MAAYAALLSLQPKIDRHLHEHPGHLQIPISSNEYHIMKDALEEIGNTLVSLDGGRMKYKNMLTLRDEFITTDELPDWSKMRRGNSSRERLNALELQIRDAVCEIEDLLETRLTDQFPVPFPLDLHEVEKHIPPFTQLLRKLKQEYMNELFDPLPEKGGDSDDTGSLRKSYSKNKSKMVGLHDEVENMKQELWPWPFNLKIVALFGMGGIGKTTVAEQVFNDLSELRDETRNFSTGAPCASLDPCLFELLAWVEVGQIYQLKRVKQRVLEQVLSSDRIDEMLAEIEEDRLDEYLRDSLTGRRYLIVLDDVWDDGFWVDAIKKLVPDDYNGSRVLLTTRRSTRTFHSHQMQMRFLSKGESWELLCEKVFGKESSCPPLLKDAGKKIADSCEGHPLTIVAVGELLLSKYKTNEVKWNKLADNQNLLYEEVYDRISKVLLPSYACLSQTLKACFLYMALFPHNHEISVSELFKLWDAEKFPTSPVKRLEVNETIRELCRNSLLMVSQKSTSYGIKTWSLHSSLWHLCKREALKSKFSYVIECRDDSRLLEGVKNLHRLGVQKNILLSIKDVQESVASISTARSLLFTGPPHPYPVPICFNLNLLRILNALSIRLYDFPMDVLKLYQLKYLALTCYESLPPSISNLWNLEVMIFHRHLSIGSSEGSSDLPIEIWDTKKLKHLQIMGSDLPEPCEGTLLPNLEKLLDVSARSCKKCVFQGIPNLNKLRIRLELTPDGHATETMLCFDHISCLENLKSLKCVVVNPTFGPDITPPHLAKFPSSLEKLSLSGFGYPWENMGLITPLPNLKTLKLQCYAFRGPELEIKDNRFPQLRFLLIENTDLVNCTVGRGSLPKLQTVFLKSCYKLENIIWDRSGVMSTKVVDSYNIKQIPSSLLASTNKWVFDGVEMDSPKLFEMYPDLFNI